MGSMVDLNGTDGLRWRTTHYLKTCIKCSQKLNRFVFYPLSYFYKDASKDALYGAGLGRHSWCKDCTQAYVAEKEKDKRSDLSAGSAAPAAAPAPSVSELDGLRQMILELTRRVENQAEEALADDAGTEADA